MAFGIDPMKNKGVEDANIHQAELDRVTEALDKAEARTQRRLNKARLHVRDELLRIDAQNNAAINELYGSRGILQHYLNA